MKRQRRYILVQLHSQTLVSLIEQINSNHQLQYMLLYYIYPTEGECKPFQSSNHYHTHHRSFCPISCSSASSMISYGSLYNLWGPEFAKSWAVYIGNECSDIMGAEPWSKHGMLTLFTTSRDVSIEKLEPSKEVIDGVPIEMSYSSGWKPCWIFSRGIVCCMLG